MSNIELCVGQRWKYHTRTYEKNSLITIVKIDNINNTKTIHIYVSNLIINKTDTSNELNTINHLPFSEEDILQSITGLVDTINVLPDFEDGYKLWKDAFDKQEAGYWTKDLKEVINIIESSVQ